MVIDYRAAASSGWMQAAGAIYPPTFITAEKVAEKTKQQIYKQ